MTSTRSWLRLASILGASTLLAAAATTRIASSPIADAAMRGDIETVRKLIKQGANVSAPQGDGMTALHWAAEHGDSVLANLLLGARANVRTTTRIGGYTPLHIASRSGSAAIVKALIEAGSDVKIPTA